MARGSFGGEGAEVMREGPVGFWLWQPQLGRVVDPQPPARWLLTLGFQWILGQLPRERLGTQMCPPMETPRLRGKRGLAEDNTGRSGGVGSPPQSA